MENIKININNVDFEFTSKVLMKHMRKIEPLSIQVQNKEIWNLDFLISIAWILCLSDNSWSIEENIDNLDMKWVEKFTKDFTPIIEQLNKDNSKK